jgi:hypothetical protein
MLKLRLMLAAQLSLSIFIGTPHTAWGQPAPTPAPANTRMAFRCEGIFGRNTDHDALVKSFGAAKVAFRGYGDGTMASFVFPDDLQRQIIFEWSDAERRRGLTRVHIHGRGSVWSVAGILVGTPMIDVERANGRPFDLNYFDGDYGGDIINWKGGSFDSALPGGCKLGATLVIDERASPTMNDPKYFASNEPLKSHDEGVRAAKPVIGGMFVFFPKQP